MRLDELRDHLNRAADDGAAPEYAVTLVLGDRRFEITTIEDVPGGGVIIYLDE